MNLRPALAATSGIAVLAVFATSFVSNRAPLSAGTVAVFSDRLFEFSATEFVHSGYAKDDSRSGQTLFECVIEGRVLTHEQSTAYRTLVQGWLLEKQGLFERLDADIALRTDEGMNVANNVGGMGIPGTHDHHDASAAHNAHDIQSNLARLAEVGPLRRVHLANDIYKDVTDIMVHLAPAIHSVGLLKEDAVSAIDDEVFVQLYRAMKQAQAANINSEQYWRAIDDAMIAYQSYVLKVQADVRAQNGAVLHALSGQWLSLQTIAPRLSEDSPGSIRRRQTQAAC